MGLTETITETVVPSFHFTSPLGVHQLGVLHVGFDLHSDSLRRSLLGFLAEARGSPSKIAAISEKIEIPTVYLTHEGTA